MGGWLGAIVGGLVKGLGDVLFGWIARRKAEANRARADSFESAHKGDVQADQTEERLRDVLKPQPHNPDKPEDFSKW